MTRDQSAATAKRISELWPTANPAQVGLAARGLLSHEYTLEETNAAMDAMFLNGVKFFEWGELRGRIIVKINPLTQPNSIESQRRRRLGEMAEQQRLADAWAEAEAAVKQLPAERRDALRAEFLAAQNESLRKMYDGIFAKGKLPKTFVDVVYQMITGKRVA